MKYFKNIEVFFVVDFKRFIDVGEFYQCVIPYLEKQEDVNNLMIGALSKAMELEDTSECLFIAGLDDDTNEVVFVMTQTKKNMILAGSVKDVKKAVAYIVNEDIQLDGVIGEKNLTETFTKSYVQATDVQAKVNMNQRIYRLDFLNDIPLVKGKLRLAQMKDVDILVTWVIDFMDAAHETISATEANIIVKRIVSQGILYVWEDKEILSMAGSARGTKHGCVVSYVYTPPKKRGQGYATACVYNLTRELLKTKEFATLYTDLSNPTSNGIYKKIGYKPIVDSIVFDYIG